MSHAADTMTPATTKNGWTIVQRASADADGLDRAGAAARPGERRRHIGGGDDDDREGGDVDNDAFEDLGAEFVDMPVLSKAARLGAACVRQDAAEIANGEWGARPRIVL
jgi:hypothetical protein